MLEREAAVTRDVVGMGMGRIRDARPDLAAVSGLRHDRVDRNGRIDDHGDPGLFVSHQVTGRSPRSSFKNW